MKERNISIDILKFLAAILITNSHMDLLYAKYDFLATGGTIGDVLFFFCSGFTLFMKPFNDGITNFLNWYKRRINRIYPTVIAVALITCLFFNINTNIIDIFLQGGGWFIQCIMLYYIIFYFIGLYAKDKLYYIIVLISIASCIWFFLLNRSLGFNMYGEEGGYLKWLLYSIYMLQGAIIGSNINRLTINPKKDIIMLFLCLICFYSFYILPRKIYAIEFLQIFNFIPLWGVVLYFYKVCSSNWIKNIYNKKIVYFTVRFIGGLCLEIYLIQFYLFTDKMNNLFPLNLIIMFIIIIIAAYLTRCISRIFSQTFKDDPYDWRRIIDWK